MFENDSNSKNKVYENVEVSLLEEFSKWINNIINYIKGGKWTENEIKVIEETSRNAFKKVEIKIKEESKHQPKSQKEEGRSSR